MVFIFLYQKLSNSPQKEIESVFTMIQRKQVDKLGISLESLKQIQSMLNLQGETKPDEPSQYKVRANS